MSPLIVRVLQHEFPISRAYKPGHIINEAEATALNQLLVENVRNNVYLWVTREAKGNGVLTAAQQADLTARISEYADRYQFKTRTRTVRLNPFEAAVRELARQYAEAWGNTQGHAPDSSEVYAKYVEFRANPEIYEEARSLILRRQSAVNTAISNLAL